MNNESCIKLTISILTFADSQKMLKTEFILILISQNNLKIS